MPKTKGWHEQRAIAFRRACDLFNVVSLPVSYLQQPSTLVYTLQPWIVAREELGGLVKRFGFTEGELEDACRPNQR